MSLKAKIEAVIYASEEPVTLAQLAGLLGQEAQAELDHLDSAQQALGLEDEVEAPADPETLNSEVLPDEELAHRPSAAEEHEALDRALHEAAIEEGREARLEAAHQAADDAAMSSAEVLEAGPVADVAVAEDAPVEEKAAQDAGRLADERHAAREEKARAARLREYFRTLLDQLMAEYATAERGIEIREVAGGYRLSTKPEYHDAVRGFVRSLKPPLKLSSPAFETLAVVAYKQPVTAPEVSEIRGVDSGGVLGSLLARKLITTAGRKQVIGRPILYKTTKEFLLGFGLKDLNDLPSIEEFEKMAGEFADLEPVQEEIPMQQDAKDGGLEPVTEESGAGVVATPEGDNEFAPEEPLRQIAENGEALETPPGSGEQAYKQDHE